MQDTLYSERQFTFEAQEGHAVFLHGDRTIDKQLIISFRFACVNARERVSFARFERRSQVGSKKPPAPFQVG